MNLNKTLQTSSIYFLVPISDSFYVRNRNLREFRLRRCSDFGCSVFRHSLYKTNENGTEVEHPRTKLVRISAFQCKYCFTFLDRFIKKIENDPAQSECSHFGSSGIFPRRGNLQPHGPPFRRWMPLFILFLIFIFYELV